MPRQAFLVTVIFLILFSGTSLANEERHQREGKKLLKQTVSSAEMARILKNQPSAVDTRNLPAAIDFPENPVGLWEFENPDSLTLATIGNDLELVGTHTPAAGPDPENGATSIGEGSFYRCFHNIEANGDGENPQWVNSFTIVMDVRLPEAGQWHSLYQTNYSNSNDGDCFIHPNGTMGISATGYSTYQLEPNQWYRLAISANLGDHYDYYLDGQLLHLGGAQAYEGVFSIYPADDMNQVLFFADDNGEDQALDVAMVALFDRDLSPQELADLGGYGHEFLPPVPAYMAPYLQAPDEDSITICWHNGSATESIVEFGESETLGTEVTGTFTDLGDDVIWHSVKLTGLLPDTDYFYQCRTDTATSETYVFRTQPPLDADDQFIRFAIYGDNRTDTNKHAEVIRAMRDKVDELYGSSLHHQLNLVMNVGDIVTDGRVLSQYPNEYFNPLSPISHQVPVMVSIGNHERESSHFYDYMKYQDMQGFVGEGYYSFRIGSVLLIALNSNVQGPDQLTWLENLLDSSDLDPQVQWVFTFTHHPGRSELWPDGNTAWVQEQVIPLLTQYDKVELLSYGHSHNYERGATIEGNLRLMLSGGGGSVLDRWGMYPNQEDYPEIHRSRDHYGYTLVEIDCAGGSYTAQSFSLGNDDTPLDNILIDSFTRHRHSPAPETPTALSPSAEVPFPVILTASPYTADQPIMSSEFELTAVENDWSAPLLKNHRDWENIYGDSGAPDFLPTDLNEDVDLSRLIIDDALLQPGTTYWWRLRQRDKNLLWSSWSAAVAFTVGDVPASANFGADITSGEAPLTVRFTDLSTPVASAWHWDLDGDGFEDSQDRDPLHIFTESGQYTVTLTVEFADGSAADTSTKIITVSAVSSVPTDTGQCFTVEQNFPNPFNPMTTVCYTIPEDAAVSIEIFNIRGHLVRRFEKGRQRAGQHTLQWDGRDHGGQAVSSGTYFYRVAAGGFSRTMKAVLAR